MMGRRRRLEAGGSEGKEQRERESRNGLSNFGWMALAIAVWLVEEVWDAQTKWLYMDWKGRAARLADGSRNKCHVTSKPSWEVGGVRATLICKWPSGVQVTREGRGGTSHQEDAANTKHQDED